MRDFWKRNWQLSPSWLSFLVVVLLALGIFFRFTNLDQKVYWKDEAFSSMRIAGYAKSDVFDEVFHGQVVGLAAVKKYQTFSPEKTVGDTINSLAEENPEHPPAYYVLARLWARYFGDSIAAIRSFSAVLSLLVFPCAYWLGMELFEAVLPTWITLGLIAISPFHVLYAQEAREYSLWTTTILLSSAALLRAIRHRTALNWGIYAVSLA
ncbi:MAG TPA: glycosyltransferase family 39 protein, partial [Candidatus Obscuribacterales bacterium]